ncbi:MAG: PadR family transcriptional regulator [Candidatus Eisenbacteria bacterium]|nr:PadR family transcriptional regulator [Candidatus Eisenbacteria bacterium]MBU1948551.1 PadR family transcriptional regulator [Candidatus Eisenbacteria bacterium]
MSALEIQNLTKSCNEILLLAILSSGPRHGYQLALEIEEKSRGHFRFNHGTLYPILHKLEKDGLIKGSWTPGDGKRQRKSYSLTSKGQKEARLLREAWRVFFEIFFNIVEEK